MSSTETARDTLTLNQAGYLADLIRGVKRGSKLSYYPRGAKDADHPATSVLRDFTHDGGGFIRADEDVRDAYVWTSGMFEHWYPVRDLMAALSNLDGHLGLDQPIATIEEA